ncbi:unnamed protein product [Urochloa humidicola]
MALMAGPTSLLCCEIDPAAADVDPKPATSDPGCEVRVWLTGVAEIQAAGEKRRSCGIPPHFYGGDPILLKQLNTCCLSPLIDRASPPRHGCAPHSVRSMSSIPRLATGLPQWVIPPMFDYQVMFSAHTEPLFRIRNLWKNPILKFGASVPNMFRTTIKTVQVHGFKDNSSINYKKLMISYQLQHAIQLNSRLSKFMLSIRQSRGGIHLSIQSRSSSQNYDTNKD